MYQIGVIWHKHYFQINNFKDNILSFYIFVNFFYGNFLIIIKLQELFTESFYAGWYFYLNFLNKKIKNF